MKRIVSILVLGLVIGSFTTPVKATQGLTYLQVFALRYDADLNHRAAVAVAKTAKFVIDGGGDQATLPKAKQVVANPEAAREAFIWYIVLDSEVQGDPTNDTKIQTVVDTFYGSLWAPEN